jgi:hypothetical protein
LIATDGKQHYGCSSLFETAYQYNSKPDTSMHLLANSNPDAASYWQATTSIILQKTEFSSSESSRNSIVRIAEMKNSNSANISTEWLVFAQCLKVHGLNTICIKPGGLNTVACLTFLVL